MDRITEDRNFWRNSVDKFCREEFGLYNSDAISVERGEYGSNKYRIELGGEEELLITFDEKNEEPVVRASYRPENWDDFERGGLNIGYRSITKSLRDLDVDGQLPQKTGERIRNAYKEAKAKWRLE